MRVRKEARVGSMVVDVCLGGGTLVDGGLVGLFRVVEFCVDGFGFLLV